MIRLGLTGGIPSAWKIGSGRKYQTKAWRIMKGDGVGIMKENSRI